MRHILYILGLVLLVTGIAGAQSSPANPLLLAAPFSMSPSGTVSLASPSTSTAYSLASPLVAADPEVPPTAPFPNPVPASTLSPDPQYVQGVFENYSWQVYLGYTFFHFGASHGISRNQNGFNYGLVYYFTTWFGIEGEMMATHDSPAGQSSWFLFGGGGPRFRWAAPKGIDLFAHGLVGYSHLTPQTAFGKQESFAYEVGGGADFPTPYRRLALRAGADMVGTQYFNGNQFNPKFYAGIVFKF